MEHAKGRLPLWGMLDCSGLFVSLYRSRIPGKRDRHPRASRIIKYSRHPVVPENPVRPDSHDEGEIRASSDAR
jgi:hypothetical protein